QVAGGERRHDRRQHLAEIELLVGKGRRQKRLQAVALFLSDKSLQGNDKRKGGGEETDDQQQERHEARADDLRAIVGDKTEQPPGREVHQQRKDERQDEDGNNDAPVAESIAHFAPRDDQRQAQIVAGNWPAHASARQRLHPLGSSHYASSSRRGSAPTTLR